MESLSFPLAIIAAFSLAAIIGVMIWAGRKLIGPELTTQPKLVPIESNQYYALHTIAFINKLVGWLIIGFGAIFCLFAFNTSTLSIIGASGFIVLLTAIGSALLGLIFIAGGQLLEAIADIATNSAQTERNTARTVDFFDRMSTNVNRREPTKPASIHPFAR